MSDHSLKAALSSTMRSVQADLDRLLAERGRLGTWQELGAPAEMEPTLGEAIAKADREIAALLARWGQLGGQVELRPPANMSQSATPPVVTRRRSATPLMMAPGRSTSRGYVGTSSNTIRSDVDEDWRSGFAEVMGQMGPGQDLAGELDIVSEAAVSCDRWSRWPKYVQRHLVGLLACRLRALQDEQGVPEYELQDGFSALTRFSKRVKPGFVFGLSRGHRPQHGSSWDDDAERHWDQLTALIPAKKADSPDQADAIADLSELVAEVAQAPSGDAAEALRKQAVRRIGEALEVGVDSRDPRLVAVALSMDTELEGRGFKRLRRALDDARYPEDDGDSPPLDVEADWGWWVHTRGRSGVIIGGDPKEAAIDRLRQAFAFAALSHVPLGDGATALQAVRAQVETGATEIIILLGDDTGDRADRELLPIARDRKVPWVYVDHGHSIGRVKSAIERFLEREGEATL
ncbi:MAG: hypothetical protein AB8H79_04060 [Myxococcota bacterium]